MANNVTGRKAAIPLGIFYSISIMLLFLGKKQLLQWGVDPGVVIVGNCILFVVTLASLLLYQRAMSHATTLGFLRNTYSGLFLKLLVCIVAVMVYVIVNKEHVNKAGLIGCVFLYFVYTIIEMRSLMQWNKARRNA